MTLGYSKENMHNTIMKKKYYVIHNHSPFQDDLQKFVQHHEDPWPLDNTIALLNADLITSNPSLERNKTAPIQ